MIPEALVLAGVLPGLRPERYRLAIGAAVAVVGAWLLVRAVMGPAS